MQRYDEDTATLLPEEHATAADACEAWASALAAEGHTLADRPSMLTREGDAWTRWTMTRTGDDAPASQWAAGASETAEEPRSARDD